MHALATLKPHCVSRHRDSALGRTPGADTQPVKQAVTKHIIDQVTVTYVERKQGPEWGVLGSN